MSFLDVNKNISDLNTKYFLGLMKFEEFPKQPCRFPNVSDCVVK